MVYEFYIYNQILMYLIETGNEAIAKKMSDAFEVGCDIYEAYGTLPDALGITFDTIYADPYQEVLEIKASWLEKVLEYYKDYKKFSDNHETMMDIYFTGNFVGDEFDDKSPMVNYIVQVYEQMEDYYGNFYLALVDLFVVCQSLSKNDKLLISA